MCTLSIIPWPDSVRIAISRDELHTRPAALPPALLNIGSRTAIMPIDPQGGGTWIAVNDRGVAMALLNRNLPHEQPSRGAVSRGLVIRQLIDADSVDNVAIRLGRLRWHSFAPFRLVVVSMRDLIDCEWNGESTMTSRRRLPRRPMMWTSSGLGDFLVEEPRRVLFEACFSPQLRKAASAGAGDHEELRRRQDAFHRHAWPDRPHLSVNMRRSDASTVSLTTIKLSLDSATLAYETFPRPASGCVYRFALPLHPNARWQPSLRCSLSPSLP